MLDHFGRSLYASSMNSINSISSEYLKQPLAGLQLFQASHGRQGVFRVVGPSQNHSTEQQRFLVVPAIRILQCLAGLVRKIDACTIKTFQATQMFVQAFFQDRFDVACFGMAHFHTNQQKIFIKYSKWFERFESTKNSGIKICSTSCSPVAMSSTMPKPVLIFRPIDLWTTWSHWRADGHKHGPINLFFRNAIATPKLWVLYPLHKGDLG